MIRFPLDPSDEELARDWTLTAEDLEQVRRCRGDEKRHSFALQLCTLRRHGRFLGDDYSHVPVRIMNYVGRQVGLRPVLFVAPPARAATDLEHEKRLREHLGFKVFDDDARGELERWLLQEAGRGLLAEELRSGAEDFLRTRRVVVPGDSTLDRMIAGVATRTEGDLLGRVHDRLSPELCRAIDELLARKGHRSELFQLKQYPPEPNPASLNAYLDRADYLREIGAGRIDFSATRPEFVLHLAELARRYDAEDLKRFAPGKRYALVACFLAEANKSVLDHLVEMHHVFLTGLHRRASHAFETRYRELRQKSGRNLRVVLDALDALLDSTREDVQKAMDVTAVRSAAEGCRELQRLTDRGPLDALRARHHTLKRYFPHFVRLPFAAEPGNEPLLDAIGFARKLHESGRTDLSDGAAAPLEFAAGIWKRALAGGVDVRTWELALAFAMRDALRSGDLYLAESRHHISFWNLVQGPEQWTTGRARAYAEMHLSPDPHDALRRLTVELDESIAAFGTGLETNRFASVSNGALVLAKRDALEMPEHVRDMRRAIEAHLPRIRIEDLLIEVDRRCGFTRELVPPAGYTQRVDNHYATLLAALVAHGTNLGVATMAQSTEGVGLDALQRITRWFLRPQALKAANRVLVNHHHGLALSSVWGDGTASSSDGQRFGVEGSSLLAGFYPRYFGFYERAITVYTHVSDQFAVFGARAISCSPREAIYVLDGLLENDTAIHPREHHTDTHGFTEQLFGLCYLLGFSFMPRLKDLKDQQLYTVEKDQAGALAPLFRGNIDSQLVREQWDQLVRVASSLRDRTAPAHVVLDRLAASAPSDRLAKALTMLGRAVKTAYILRYLHEPLVRDRVHLQLNRGESRHEVARRLFFANQGAFRSGDYAEIMNKVSALSVLSNAVLLWNTVHFERIVRELEGSTGKPIAREDLARISPLAHAHVIPSGTYHFDKAGTGPRPVEP